jgi:hypothetical protein
MPRSPVVLVTLVTLLAATVLSACGAAAPAADTSATAPAAGAEQPGAVTPAMAEPTAMPPSTAMPEPTAAGDAGDAGLAGADFIARAHEIKGGRVTLGRCSLLTEPSPSGLLGCRVVDESGTDLMDYRNLPVDVFITVADLDSAAQAFLAAECPDTFCLVKLSGVLDVAAGTEYMSMTEVAFAKP